MRSSWGRDGIARNAPATAFTQSIRMSPPAWTASTDERVVFGFCKGRNKLPYGGVHGRGFKYGFRENIIKKSSNQKGINWISGLSVASEITESPKLSISLKISRIWGEIAIWDPSLSLRLFAHIAPIRSIRYQHPLIYFLKYFVDEKL
jgi:hypothetical protein